MAPQAWGLFLACALGAEVVGTMAGFGAATILTPFAALFLDMKTAIAMVACFHLFGNASRLWFFGRAVDWRMWVQFGLTGILFSLLGAGVTTRLTSAAVGRLFGAFLLVYVGSAFLLPERTLLPKRPATLVVGGVVSGFIAGLLGTGGAARSVCLMAFGLPAVACGSRHSRRRPRLVVGCPPRSQAVYLGTSAAIALVVDATRIPVYLASGLIPRNLMPVLASLVVVAFAGSWIGQRLVRCLSAVRFRRFVLVILALMGIKLLWRV